MVLDDREAYELSCSIEPSTSGASSARSSEKFRRKLVATNASGNGNGGYGHRKNDSIASTSSSSSSQFLSELDNIANLSIGGDTSSFESKAFPVIWFSFVSSIFLWNSLSFKIEYNVFKCTFYFTFGLSNWLFLFDWFQLLIKLVNLSGESTSRFFFIYKQNELSSTSLTFIIRQFI